MGLPAYDGPMLVNEGMLDRPGLSYPDPKWKLEDAVRLWESGTGRDPSAPDGWRYGVQLQWYAGDWGGYWLPAGWGGNWIDASLTRPLFSSAPCVASIRWITDLFDRKVAIARGAPTGFVDGWDRVHRGQSVMAMVGGWETLPVGVQGGREKGPEGQ